MSDPFESGPTSELFTDYARLVGVRREGRARERVRRDVINTIGDYDASYPPFLWSAPPVIHELAPTTGLEGQPVTLTVTGMGYETSSVVYAGSSPLPTTFVSETELSAVWTPSAPGSVMVTVRNGTRSSNGVAFVVTAIPTPVVASVAPTKVALGATVTLVVTGSELTPSSVVYADETALPTVYVSATELTATYTGAVAATVQVTVRDGPRVSNAVPIEVAEVFSPANIPGLVGWWDAADETTFIYSSGTEISEWLDKSPVGWHMTQTVISQQPGRQDAIQNGLAAIAYNPALWELMSAPTNVGKPFTLFFASSSYAGRLTWWSTTGGIYWATDSGNFYFGGPQAGPVTPADWLPLAYAFRNDGGAPAGTVFFRNGVAATGGIAAGESVQNLSVGSPTSDKFEAWHFEAILSNVYLSDAQMAEVSAYLREKWATP